MTWRRGGTSWDHAPTMNQQDIHPSMHRQNLPMQARHIDVKAQAGWTEDWCSTIPSGIERTMGVRHSCLSKVFQILSPWEENTQGGYIFILNITCYKWEIHELFMVVRTLQVWWELTKCPAFKRLHLWRNWRVLYLIPHSLVKARAPSTKMTITSCSKVGKRRCLLGVKIDPIIFPTI
jgi:hypothetical protein